MIKSFTKRKILNVKYRYLYKMLVVILYNLV